MRFRTFQARLLAFLGGLILMVQSLVMAAVYVSSRENARLMISRELEGTGRDVLLRQLDSLSQRYIEAARLLSSDFAFKAVYAANDRATLLSAIQNQLWRLPGADLMMIVSLDGRVVADPRHAEQSNVAFPWSGLMAAAERSATQEAAVTVDVGGTPHQLVVTPLLMPDPSAWIVVGFPIDVPFVTDLARLIGSEVSVLKRVGQQDHWHVAASSLPQATSGAVADLQRQRETRAVGDGGFIGQLGDQEAVVYIAALANTLDVELLIVLQRPLAEALRPYRRVQQQLALILAAGLVLSVLGSIGLARNVTRPVRELVHGAGRVAAGDYSHRIHTTRVDEIGVLAQSFNAMTKGLSEKEKVRTLLGKVVSPAVAEELLASRIALGGEERPVSILFSDIRRFTALCERHSPGEILGLLNIYFTRLSAVVDGQGGVIDKFIGDALMALFGAPLSHPDDAARAVRAALQMVDAQAEINRELIALGLPSLASGIGINTGQVVAGNIGSPTRMNYTVVGDAVNLASRLEGLTKCYGVPIIVSAETKARAPDFVYRELDRICVKGKREPVTIHQPLGLPEALSAAALDQLARFEHALALYRAGSWSEAAPAFRQCGDADPVAMLYLHRIAELRNPPPGSDWNAVHDPPAAEHDSPSVA